MVQLLLSGCNGRMGHAVEAICAAEPELELTAGFDLLGADIRDFPVYASPAEFQGEADVVVDFSSPSALPALLSFGLEHRMPLVLATTGYDQGQLEEIQQAARSIPIFRSANLSLGVNILVELVRRTAAVLGGSCDIEIVERHHNKKMDAPSGTALMLAEAAADALPCQPELVCGRQGIRRSRERCEIGISSVRGGGIVGDHEVLFAGRADFDGCFGQDRSSGCVGSWRRCRGDHRKRPECASAAEPYRVAEAGQRFSGGRCCRRDRASDGKLWPEDHAVV